jgi:hypothetical protein
MFDWIEICLAAAMATFLMGAFVPLYLAVESFILTSEVLSQVTIRVTDTLRSEGIQVGALPTDIRILPNAKFAGALKAV